jgi:23S rRNA (pseudouridine1915-N3)-methyltransferase
MKLSFWAIGKAHEPYLKEGVLDFTKRIGFYYPVEWTIIPAPKNAATLSEAALKRKEGKWVLSQLKADDFLITLDEHGKEFTSEQLAGLLDTRANDSTRNIVFLIGGAFGIDEAVFKKAQIRWSLSKLTFPHQLVRLILAEQIYRACTILRNEKYHHR